MRFLPLATVEAMLAEHPALLCAARDAAAQNETVLHVEDVLPVGSAVYVHVLRDEKLYPVCGACEGAKTFDVPHRDGTVHALPCAKCEGKGKLYSSKTRPVIDVMRAEVGGLRYDVGSTEGYMFKGMCDLGRIMYRVKTATAQDAWWVWKPGLAEDAATPTVQETLSYFPNPTVTCTDRGVTLDRALFWRTRKAAQTHADAFNLQLRARYDQEGR